MRLCGSTVEKTKKNNHRRIRISAFLPFGCVTRCTHLQYVIHLTRRASTTYLIAETRWAHVVCADERECVCSSGSNMKNSNYDIVRVRWMEIAVQMDAKHVVRNDTKMRTTAKKRERKNSVAKAKITRILHSCSQCTDANRYVYDMHTAHL